MAHSHSKSLQLALVKWRESEMVSGNMNKALVIQRVIHRIKRKQGMFRES